MSDFQRWKRERDRAISELDMDYARRTLPDATSDEVRLIALHKARYNCLAVHEDLRRASQTWLAERGFTDGYGSPVKVGEALPK